MLGVLLIGFERLDFLLHNLEILGQIRGVNAALYVSIDGPKDRSNKGELLSQKRDLLIKKAEGLGAECFINQRNMGCDAHIPWAIQKVLEGCDQVIVIEDDVRISSSSLLEMIRKMSEKSESLEPLAIVGMSAFFVPTKHTGINSWRTTKFFSAWGFGINQRFWNCHIKSSSEIKPGLDWDSFFESSNTWNKLSNRKKELWIERFQRGNYDYAIQSTMFRFDLRAIAPVFRMVDNVGHGLSGATHTRFEAPIYLRFRVSENKQNFSNHLIYSSITNLLFDFCDSNSWAGEGVLSRRGRTWGVRTRIRKRLERNT